MTQSLVWALGIALLATLLAWPLAWWLRRSPRTASLWVITPLFMPGYLAYAGWGLLRAPGSYLGDRLELLAEQGHRWVPIAAGQALAFVGLSLWSAPIAAIVLAASLRSIDHSVLESLRLDSSSPFRRTLTLVSLTRRSLVSAGAVVALLMLGSAVPLHLAQVKTLAVDLWFELDNTPARDHWRVWLHAWPLLLIAAVAGWFIAGRLTNPDPHGDATANLNANSSTLKSFAARLPPTFVLVLAVGIPIALFATRLNSFTSLERFWTLNANAVAHTATIAALVACFGFLFAVLVAWGLESRRPLSTLVRASVRFTVILGLVPGILVGSVINRTLGSITWLADSPLIVVFAHLARFAIVPALVACWVVRHEPQSQRSLRILESGNRFIPWLKTTGLPALAPLLASGLAAGLLSLHEIESAVQVMPPGQDSLPRQILQYLHFSRLEEMSAAAVWLVVVGLVLAAIVGRLCRPLVITQPIHRTDPSTKA